MQTTVGVLAPPLGYTRLQVSRLFSTLMSVNDSQLHDCLTQHNVLNKLLDLFFQYLWNNFLHSQVELCVDVILSRRCAPPAEDTAMSSAELDTQQNSSGQDSQQSDGQQQSSPSEASQSEASPEDGSAQDDSAQDNSAQDGSPQEGSPQESAMKESSSQESSSQESSPQEGTSLIIHLLRDCQLLERITTAWHKNEQTVSEGRQRAGYMGHLTKMCNSVIAAGENGPYANLIQNIVKELPEEICSSWQELCMTQLAEANRRNTTDLVSSQPLNSSSDSDSDFKDIPFPRDDSLQQAFSDYQIQQLTSNFIDQFGLNEDEFGDSNTRLDSAFGQPSTASDWENNASEVTDKQFTSVCEMRAQKFDGSEDSPTGSDDEDVWNEKEITFAKKQASSSPSGLPENVTLSDTDSESSSDEELASPQFIRSKPGESAGSVKEVPMDIDQPSGAAPTESAAGEVAMDTSPWDGADPAPDTSADDGWAAFSDPVSEPGKGEWSEGGDEAGWADFSSLDSVAEGPRASSPGALQDASSESPANQKYRVASDRLAAGGAPPALDFSEETEAGSADSAPIKSSDSAQPSMDIDAAEKTDSGVPVSQSLEETDPATKDQTSSGNTEQQDQPADRLSSQSDRQGSPQSTETEVEEISASVNAAPSSPPALPLNSDESSHSEALDEGADGDSPKNTAADKCSEQSKLSNGPSHTDTLNNGPVAGS